jgi:hypothetical protein
MPVRRAGRVPCYFWISDVTRSRIGWVFPSEKAAKQWRDAKWWKYAEHPILENYLRTVGDSAKEKERKAWMVHRDNYNDWYLGKGEVRYDTKDY